jgi:branched-chain amino acid transport system ATP-binding protein
MLKVENINVSYDTIQVLHDLSFHVDEGEIVTLIGANGAGKTTTMHTVSGLIRAKSGTVSFQGKDITHVPADRIVQLGLSQVPEGRRIFANMTVMENLDMGAFGERSRTRKAENLQQVFRSFPRLLERRNQSAGTLSGGEQQMLAIGRALMAHPKLLLLDEPSMGLSPLLVKEIFSIIKEISRSGTTVLLVEQNARMALSIANRAYVLETGRVVASGDAKELSESEEVRKAYLGM